MTWVIGITLLLGLLCFVILKNGSLNFWKLAARNADVAYDHFLSESCWQLFEEGLPSNYRTIVPKSEWVGPFRISVPKLGGKTICVFGRHPDYEQSQIDLMNKIGDRL